MRTLVRKVAGLQPVNGYPWQESNLRIPLRRRTLYPLSYRGVSRKLTARRAAVGRIRQPIDAKVGTEYAGAAGAFTLRWLARPR